MDEIISKNPIISNQAIIKNNFPILLSADFSLSFIKPFSSLFINLISLVDRKHKPAHHGRQAEGKAEGG